MIFKNIKKSYLPQARSRILIFFTILIFYTVTTGAIFDVTAKRITVNEVNEFTGLNESKVIKTRRDSVGQFLEENSITVGSYDKLSVKETNALQDGMTVTIRRGVPISVETADGILLMGTTQDTAGEAAAELGFGADGAETELVPSADEKIAENGKLKVINITYNDVVFEENIPFEEKRIEDNSMLRGETRVVTPGHCGVKQSVYHVRYRDGVEDYGTLVSESVTLEPVAQVTAYGTLEKAVEVKATKGIASGGLSSRGVMRYKTKLTMNASAYDSSPAQNGGHSRTAIGLVPELGVVAVDPSVIPLGSRLYIESTDGGSSWVYGYAIAGDTGGAIKGNRIDLCYPSNSQCRAFGRRQATVYVLE